MTRSLRREAEPANSIRYLPRNLQVRFQRQGEEALGVDAPGWRF